MPNTFLPFNLKVITLQQMCGEYVSHISTKPLPLALPRPKNNHPPDIPRPNIFLRERPHMRHGDNMT